MQTKSVSLTHSRFLNAKSPFACVCNYSNQSPSSVIPVFLQSVEPNYVICAGLTLSCNFNDGENPLVSATFMIPDITITVIFKLEEYSKSLLFVWCFESSPVLSTLGMVIQDPTSSLT
jgi:hypothetical protein